MPMYRKKPVVIEAVRFDWSPHTADEICRMNGGEDGLVFDEKGVTIRTLEGNMLGQCGDYIIKGVQGELYPIKGDIFETTYEPA